MFAADTKAPSSFDEAGPAQFTFSVDESRDPEQLVQRFRSEINTGATPLGEIVVAALAAAVEAPVVAARAEAVEALAKAVEAAKAKERGAKAKVGETHDAHRLAETVTTVCSTP